jgi:hypothetical protein
VAAGVAAAAGGCATVPTGGAPRAISGAAGQPQAYVQPLPPPPPEPGWKPKQVVLAFLHASASFELDPGAARQYLAPGWAREHWTPPGAVTVVAPSLKLTPETVNLKNVQGGQSYQFTQVTLTGQQVATLNVSGQYSYQPGTATYTFKLEKDNGIWLIENPPSQHPVLGSPPSGLLLTDSDFQLLYQPRNLYFFARGAPYLVPDPVFAPLQGANSALNTNLATGLVRALRADQGSWLSGATTTAFPAGTTVDGPVRISDGTAVVKLGGAAAAAPRARIADMYEQLWLTLTNGSYSTPVASSVQLWILIKNKLVMQQLGAGAAGSIPQVGSSSEPLYFVSGQDTVSKLAPDGTTPTLALGSEYVGTPSISAVAVSRGQQPKIAVAGPDGGGCGASVAVAGASLDSLSTTGGACTSLSWDGDGNLWATAGNRIWVLRAGAHARPEQVNVAPLTAALGSSAGFRVLALRMAPDSVRAAVLVQDKASGNQVLLAAVSDQNGSLSFGRAVPVGGSSFRNPTALSWYNPYFLLVLNGSELLQVPLTGGAAQELGPVPATSAVVTSIATNGSTLAVGTSANQVWISPEPDTTWQLVGPRKSAYGLLPAYPG